MATLFSSLLRPKALEAPTCHCSFPLGSGPVTQEPHVLTSSLSLSLLDHCISSPARSPCLSLSPLRQIPVYIKSRSHCPSSKPSNGFLTQNVSQILTMTLRPSATSPSANHLSILIPYYSLCPVLTLLWHPWPSFHLRAFALAPSSAWSALSQIICVAVFFFKSLLSWTFLFVPSLVNLFKIIAPWATPFPPLLYFPPQHTPTADMR